MRLAPKGLTLRASVSTWDVADRHDAAPTGLAGRNRADQAVRGLSPQCRPAAGRALDDRLRPYAQRARGGAGLRNRRRGAAALRPVGRGPGGDRAGLRAADAEPVRRALRLRLLGGPGRVPRLGRAETG